MVSKETAQPLLSKDCPVRHVINIVGDKWTLPVLYVLNDGTKRYNEIQKAIPEISKKMLTQTLRNLESDKILSRKVYPVVPPKTEYSLTDFGQELIVPLEALSDWALAHQTELKQICDRRTQREAERRAKKASNKKK